MIFKFYLWKQEKKGFAHLQQKLFYHLFSEMKKKQKNLAKLPVFHRKKKSLKKTFFTSSEVINNFNQTRKWIITFFPFLTCPHSEGNYSHQPPSLPRRSTSSIPSENAPNSLVLVFKIWWFAAYLGLIFPANWVSFSLGHFNTISYLNAYICSLRKWHKKNCK